MFDSATINLFVAITLFVIVTVGGRDLLVRRGLSKSVAQAVSGVVAIVIAVALLMAVG